MNGPVRTMAARTLDAQANANAIARTWIDANSFSSIGLMAAATVHIAMWIWGAWLGTSSHQKLTRPGKGHYLPRQTVSLVGNVNRM